MSDPLDLSGKVAIVTGGARGVTAEVAIALARKGAPRLALLGPLSRSLTASATLNADGGLLCLLQPRWWR